MHQFLRGRLSLQTSLSTLALASQYSLRELYQHAVCCGGGGLLCSVYFLHGAVCVCVFRGAVCVVFMVQCGWFSWCSVCVFDGAVCGWFSWCSVCGFHGAVCVVFMVQCGWFPRECTNRENASCHQHTLSHEDTHAVT